MPPLPAAIEASNNHIQEAKNNYDRYKRLLEDDRDIDWALVLLFYSAVHLVQAHAMRHLPHWQQNHTIMTRATNTPKSICPSFPMIIRC